MAKASTDTIYVLNGPNLNLLGVREPEKYGHARLADVEKLCVQTAAQYGLKADCRQSNREGELIDFIHEARAKNRAGETSAAIGLPPLMKCSVTADIGVPSGEVDADSGGC